MMFVSFYTMRVILSTLGIDDYGIYNVVGGFVAMFSMITGSLNAACVRFLNYAMGKGNRKYINCVFSTELSIQTIFAIIVFILSETIGLWFVNCKLVIPPDRLIAANWCYQFSVINFCIGLTQVPYTSSVIAHEKMDTFAYMGIYDATVQLLISYLIAISPLDKLVCYAALLFANSFVVLLIYRIYCKINFEECTYHFIIDKVLVKEIFSFSGWNLIGASSAVLRDEGNNILLNLFFGPSVNAARGIGNKVHGTAVGFVNNFLTAMNPQITQSYSSGDNDYMFKLIFKGARLSFYMMLMMAIPLIINARYILKLWLVEVPEESILFGQLAFVLTLVSILSNPLITAQLATGKIRNYQIIVGGIQMLNVPLSYICLTLGCIPQVVLIVAILCEFLCLLIRIYLLRSMIGLNAKTYVREVVVNVLLVTLIAVPLPALLAFCTDDSLSRLFSTSVISIISVAMSIYYIGCSKDEREMVHKYVIDKINFHFLRND